MPDDDKRLTLLLKDLALSWPPKGKYMDRSAFEILWNNSEQIERLEENRGGGQLNYMYLKMKMHADHYHFSYSIPDNWEEDCEEFRKEHFPPTFSDIVLNYLKLCGWVFGFFLVLGLFSKACS